MINEKFFFDQVRARLFDGRLSTKQFNGLKSILDEWQRNWQNKDDRWLAYMLATTHHETDRKMQPIEEYGKGRNKDYGRRLKMDRTPYTDTIAIFYGRGLVQITWYENYKKAGIKLGINLIQHPELALDVNYSTQILFHGMNEGWFTTKKLDQYFNSTTEDWRNARRIINGIDKADLIAYYAKKYYSCISYTI
jgi:predicted chitinase